MALLLASCGGGGGGGGSGVAPALQVASAIYVPAYGDKAEASTYFTIEVTNRPADGVWVGLQYTTGAISRVGLDPGGGWKITFRDPRSLAFGAHEDELTVTVCRDPQCQSHIAGSPATIAVTLDVREVEPDATALPFADQEALGHDVIDAEFSETLDAVVMTSKNPSNALYLYDTASGTERSLALDYEPTSLSIGPDGMSAAVGHSARITIVDLARLDDPVVSPKILLDVSVASFSVSLPGNGYVYAFPRDVRSGVRSIEIGTNDETVSRHLSSNVYAMRLHASGNTIYGVNYGTLERYGTAMGPVNYEYREFGYFPPFGPRTWLDEAGERVFSDAGRVFHASDRVGRDLTYAGALELSPDPHGFASVIRWLSDSSEHGEVALLEESPLSCDYQIQDDCFTHLGLYEAGYLDLAARYSLPLFERAGVRHRQLGRFVFHSQDGTARFVISRLAGVADPAQAYLIGRVTVTGSPPPGPDPEPPPTPVINASTEVGVPAAFISDPTALPHDVAQAEYSSSLDAIVMTSSYPTNAVYVYDVAAGEERKIALGGIPTALTLGPGGAQAAVAHDARITVLDLAPVAPAAPIVVDTTAHDPHLVLTGNGFVYAFPRTNGSVSIGNVHSINVSTNTETLSTATTYSFHDVRANPSGTRIYAVPYVASLYFQLFSADGTAQFLYDTNWSEDTCYRLWFSESGTRIYTGCGNVFAPSDTQGLDGTFLAKLAIGTNPNYNTPAVSVSESAEAQRISLLEADSLCQFGLPESNCESHLVVYNSASLARLARYTLPALTVGSRTYRQRGLFVFYRADGAGRYVISQLRGMPYPYAEFYVSRLP